MWPFKRKQPTAKPPELANDWKLAEGPWGKQHRCHCGQDRRRCVGAPAYFTTLWGVCPSCGCADKWEEFVGREVYERRWLNSYTTETRNYRIERWTPEHCSIEKEK